MMLVLRGLQNSNSLVILGLVILSLVFMIQIKQIYNNNQKYNRYITYKQYVRSKCLYRYFNNRKVIEIIFVTLLMYFELVYFIICF